MFTKIDAIKSASDWQERKVFLRNPHKNNSLWHNPQLYDTIMFSLSLSFTNICSVCQTARFIAMSPRLASIHNTKSMLTSLSNTSHLHLGEKISTNIIHQYGMHDLGWSFLIFTCLRHSWTSHQRSKYVSLSCAEITIDYRISNIPEVARAVGLL